MIFGKTDQQREKKRQKRLKELEKGYWWFAWFPVQLCDGRFVWLQKVFVDSAIFELNGNYYKASTIPNSYYIKNPKVECKE